MSLRFLYRLESDRWFFEGRVGAALLVGFDRYGTTNGVVEPALQLAWLYDLPRPSWLTRLSVGPTLGVREFLGYYGSWDDSHLYWLGSTALSASARAWVELGGRDLELGLSLPVVALVSRPPRYVTQKISPVTSPGYWLFRFADHPVLTSWHQLQAVTVEVQWRARGDRWAVDPFVAVDFTSFATPARATYLTWWVGLEVRR